MGMSFGIAMPPKPGIFLFLIFIWNLGILYGDLSETRILKIENSYSHLSVYRYIQESAEVSTRNILH